MNTSQKIAVLFQMDHALIIISNLLNVPIEFNYNYNQCYHCQDYQTGSIQPRTDYTLLVSTNWFINWTVYANNTNNNTLKAICQKSIRLNQHVKYEYLIESRQMHPDDQETYNCTLNYLTSETSDYLLPLYILLVIIALLFIGYFIVLSLYRRRIIQNFVSMFSHRIDSLEDLGRPGDAQSVSLSEDESPIDIKQNSIRKNRRRIKSIDCLRGLSLILMIFVNYGGGGYWFLQHSTWNGLTLADLVFPWFVFVMGLSVAVIQIRTIRRNKTKTQWLHIWLCSSRRSIVLFLIGLGLESRRCNGELSHLRIMGPLQRLAISYWCLLTFYCVTSVVLQAKQLILQSNKLRRVTLSKPTVVQNSTDETENSNISNTLLNSNEVLMEKPKFQLKRYLDKFNLVGLAFCWPYILLIIGLCIGHICISKFLRQSNNCPKGYMGPGGVGDWGCCTNCTGGAARFIDLAVLGSNHMYQRPTTRQLYLTDVAYDPEGILGNMTSLALCLIGFWAGSIILLSGSFKSLLIKLVILMLICVAVGLGLCEAKMNGGFIPINKNLWSVSFIMITAATAIFLLIGLFLSTDIYKFWSGAPFRIVGQNSIVLYVGHELLRNCFPVQFQVPYNHTFQLIMSCWGVLFWILISYCMHFKRIFVTI